MVSEESQTTYPYTVGDIVELLVQKNAKSRLVKGTILERAQLLDPHIVVVKLENGYNVGIDKKHILKVKVLETIKPVVQTHSEKKKNPALPTVALLSIGGTISSKLDYRTGGVVAGYTASDFLDMIPEVLDIANVECKSIMNVMSEDMSTIHWIKTAKAIAKELNRKDICGVVVTQGTDTLHFVTSAVSFLLGKINKPVIFTAAQKSIDRGSSDAFMNIILAIKAAAQWNGACVAVCMHETTNDKSCFLLRGTTVRKMHTSARNAFRPINEPALARIDEQKITIINSAYPLREDCKVACATKMESKVGLVTIYPGIQPGIIEHYMTKKYRGLVISATALGHVPANILSVLKKASKTMLVVITTQTIYGRVHPFVYSRLREMSIGANLLFCDSLLTETAYTKLSYVLGQRKMKADCRKIFMQNLCGEFVGEISYDSFLY